MRTLREWIHRLLETLRPGRSNDDVEEELRLHLELAAEDGRRRGLSSADSARAARLKAGDASQAMDAVRDQRGLPWVDDLARDVRHGFRTLGHTPMFTAIALLTLALGIGANATIFTIVNGVILRPLGYPKPKQLMYLAAEFPTRGLTRNAVSVPEYMEFRQINQSFAAVGAYTTGGGGYTTGEVNLTAGDRPLRVRSVSVDAYLLNTLGVQPALGRFFSEHETARWSGTLAPPIAILSHELWQTAFGGQPVVGKTVEVEGRAHEILGIMPPAADVMDNRTQIWLPLWVHPNAARQRGFHVLYVIARLKDGVTAEAAQTELNLLLNNWGERVGTKDHVPTNGRLRPADHILQLRPLQDAIVGNATRSIWVLQAAVGFVLLIVCANLGNLVMAHAESRRREFVVRAALGASRGRLLRQTMTEGVLLSGAGGMLGVCLAYAGVQALIRTYPDSMPRISDVVIDVPVLLVAIGLSTATALLFGLALVGHRVSGLVTALKEGGERGASGAGRYHIRRTLMIGEVALAVMLVISAGLLIRTVYNLTSVDAGFDRSRLVTFSMTLPMATSEPDTRAQAYQRVLERLRAAPGVQGATVMSGLPPNRPPDAIATRIENYTAADGRPVEVIDYYQFVMGDYFETMGIPIVAGRGFERTDTASQGKMVVVNETLANRIWKGQNPIGQRLRPNLTEAIGASDNPWHTVIGVAKDVKQRGIEHSAGTELYVSLNQHGISPATMNVVLRTTLPPAALSGTLERLVREVDPAAPIVRLRDMESVFVESIPRPRLLAQLLGTFAGLALLLAAVGTYGVLSYMVTQRRREIGIRMALGAARSSVIALVMKQGVQATIIGVIVGLAGALGVNRLMTSLLFGVQPTDAARMAAVIATITIVATIACWLPAWRASQLDPNVVLRTD